VENKLICVECAPVSVPGQRKPVSTPLTGFVGETFERYLKRDSRGHIPVRFPLLGPGSHVSLIRNDRDPLDPQQLHLEGEMLDPSSLYALPRKVPLSLYTRVPMGDFGALVERPEYMSTYSLSEFHSLLANAFNSFGHSWTWKIEKLAAEMTYPLHKHIFIEARVYGIDSILTTYGGRAFGGIALQVIYKPQPTKQMLDQGIRVLRTCSDLLLFSNTEEYISYIDGITIQREQASPPSLRQRYKDGYISPKEATSLNRFADYHEQIKKERKQDKTKGVENKEFTKDVPPPPKKKKTYTYEMGPTATTFSNNWVVSTSSTTTGAK
jgi:hypothetical protein